MPIGTGDLLGKRAFPFSLRELAKFAGGSGSAQRMMLARLAVQDCVFWFDDFIGDTLNLDSWIVGETGTGTVFGAPATGIVGGAITGITGATDNNAEVIYGHRVWAGDNNCVLEMRARLNVIGANAFEVGWIDSAADLTLPVVSDVDTPAFQGTLADAAVLHYDTDQTLVTMALVSEGSTANMNATATTLSPTFVPTVDTFHRYRVGIAGDIPYALVDGGRHTTGTGVLAQRTEGGSLVRPWLAVRTRAAAAVTTNIDYIWMFQDRAVRTA